jgi:hypothetical protein
LSNFLSKFMFKTLMNILPEDINFGLEVAGMITF